MLDLRGDGLRADKFELVTAGTFTPAFLQAPRPSFKLRALLSSS
jgi:hypothetical protein